MKRFLIIAVLLSAFCLSPYAQQRKKTGKKPAATSVQQKKKPANKKPAQKKKGKKKPAATNSTIKGLQNQRQQLQRQIKEQEQRLRNNEKDVKARLQNLMVLNTEIEDKKRSIEAMRMDLSHLNDTIAQLSHQMVLLQEQIVQHKAEYVKSLRFMQRNRSLQSKLMFIFSAKNFSQMYRRTLFLRHYAAYQREQGEAIMQKKQELTRIQAVLLDAKDQ